MRPAVSGVALDVTLVLVVVAVLVMVVKYMLAVDAMMAAL